MTPMDFLRAITPFDYRASTPVGAQPGPPMWPAHFPIQAPVALACCLWAASLHRRGNSMSRPSSSSPT